MKKMPFNKYKRYPIVNLQERRWPSNEINIAPIWCSVDLRDGNQSLVTPMNLEEKLEFFKLLLDMGFKEIEVGFPSASEVEYEFLRTIIDEKLIPEDVTIQVLTQARKDLIEKTFEAIKGTKKAIVHLYNSTSTLQRKVVFGKGKEEIIELAVMGTKLIKEYSKVYTDTEIIFEYSPESFTGTELDFALEICEAVLEVWKPTEEKRAIINLPSTVEMATPNVYADQIEWMSRNIKNRECVIISVHAHNDRGTGVAASELAMLAGADRVEGTLFGNGERTGNADLITIALNLFTQGIDPKLNIDNIDKIIDVYERCNKIDMHVRHPYAGALVYTAFSGSHQDAIKKGMNAYKNNEISKVWEVPYLPIDPCDLGRSYESIIRINSQSGKGGVAYIMEADFGFILPKAMHFELGKLIQKISDETGKEILPSVIYDTFKKEYLNVNQTIKFVNCKFQRNSQDSPSIVTATIIFNDKEIQITGEGNGPIDAFSNGIKQVIGEFKLISYSEHSIETGSNSTAVAYIQIENEKGEKTFGAGMDNNISLASIKALISAVNRDFHLNKK